MDDTYQNPLYTPPPPAGPTIKTRAIPAESRINILAKNPKILTIASLFAFTLILLLVTAIVGSGKKQTISQPTPTPTGANVVNAPATPNFQLVPESLKSSFDSIDQKIKNPDNFLPQHQIDPDIGLN